MESKSKKTVLWKLFLSTFYLSAFTFGGGYVIVPLMRKKFVEQLHWIEEQEMLDLTALSQSAPGPIAVNASLLVGYHVAGIPGALITVLGTVLPPLIIISVISVFYAAFRDNPIVSLVMLGMQAGVAAVICDVVVTMAKGVLSQKRIIPAVMMALAFLAAVFLDINLVIILLVCGCVGAVETIWRDKHQKEEQA